MSISHLLAFGIVCTKALKLGGEWSDVDIDDLLAVATEASRI
jgi:hypothetical protein